MKLLSTFPCLPKLSLLALLSLSCITAHADESDRFFDDSYVHEIRLTFEDSDWYTTLPNSHAKDAADPYFPASFTGDGVSLSKIGVRMKGNSSFNVKSIKKSLKLDFDEYDEGNAELGFLGLKKLNLNNSFKDPTMLREKLFLDFAAAYIPTIRCVHVRVYVNDEYLGLYTAVEQVDKHFIQDRFGESEDGNLYKGTASDDIADQPMSDFGSTFAWEGSEESAYYDHYQLKTNEEANDYSGLVSMIDVLNNTDPDSFPENLEPLMDIDNVLAGLALNSLFSNHDSYNGTAHNFYVYQSDSTHQFSHILWDTNESFGTFSMFAQGMDMTQIDPSWLPSNQDRPLLEKLLANETYKNKYLMYHATMLRNGFDVANMTARIEKLAALIRTDVYADNNKEYSNEAFEQNLYSNYTGGSGRDSATILGLQSFVKTRASYLSGVLPTYSFSQPFDGLYDLGSGFLWSSGTGYFYQGYFPFIYAFNTGGWFYVFESTDSEGYYLYDFSKNQFGYTGKNYYPYYVVLPMTEPLQYESWDIQQ